MSSVMQVLGGHPLHTTASPLSCPRARQLYRIERLHSPLCSVTVAVHRDVIKDPLCRLQLRKISACV